MPQLKNLIGQKFGRLLVLERDLSKKGTFWRCQCDCGNIISIRGDSLSTGKTTSCGCYRKEQARKATGKKLKGQIFGHIEVLEDLDYSNNQNRLYHRCRCMYCGTIFDVCTTDLTAHRIDSCGCQKSKGEQRLINIFIQNSIKYIREYTFKDLYSKNDIYKKHPLRFDFYLPDYNVLIEYQGIQHYDKDNRYYSEQMVENDQIKKDYCKLHNIKLIEINYKDYNQLDYNYIKKLL